MPEQHSIVATVTFLGTDEGGRKKPASACRDYMPHIVIGDPYQREALVDEHNRMTEHYLGVSFEGNSGEELSLGASHVVSLTLMYHPMVDYSAVQPGATFTLREGGKVVGYGVVETRTPEANSPGPRSDG